ncbi:metallopeptidase family protein [Bifidobacterium moraviense]|nr:metallopeptidase family protein [Bifidobacterium sp. DSM 109958]
MHMTDAEFESAVEEALAGVPERFRRALDNVCVAVADEPDEDERASMCDPDGELLGLYRGVPITERTTAYGGVMPDVITVFKGPHERVCRSRAEMVDEIRRTVLHELGHYFGFDDDYLHAHGY